MSPCSPAADRGMEFMVDNLYDHGDWMMFQDPGTGGIQLGASALMLAGLMQRRIATEDPRFDDISKDVARGCSHLQLPDGAFLNRWDVTRDSPIPEERSKYATGEAFWGLTLMHRFFPGEGWDRAAIKTADYLALYRDDYEKQEVPARGRTSGQPTASARWQRGHRATSRSLTRVRSRSASASSSASNRNAVRTGFRRCSTAARRAPPAWALGRRADVAPPSPSIDPRMADMEAKLAERVACGAGMLAERQVSPSEAEDTGNPERHAARGSRMTSHAWTTSSTPSRAAVRRPILANREPE